MKTQELSQKKLIQSAKKHAIKKISLKKRKTLIKMVLQENQTVYKSAKKLRINESTAKSIIRRYKLKGSLFFKKGQGNPDAFLSISINNSEREKEQNQAQLDPSQVSHEQIHPNQPPVESQQPKNAEIQANLSELRQNYIQEANNNLSFMTPQYSFYQNYQPYYSYPYNLQQNWPLGYYGNFN